MKLLCFGDSNTYGYDPRSFLDNHYPADVRWTDTLARDTGWTVLNMGETVGRSPAVLQKPPTLQKRFPGKSPTFWW